MLVELVCVAELVDTFNTDIRFDIPEFIAHKDLTPPSIEYVTAPPYRDENGETYGLPAAYECKQTFSFRMLNAGELPPAEMELDTNTGIFEVLNYESDTQSYQIEIDIMTTDSVNDYPLTLTGVTVSTVCGPDSTTLTAPVLEDLYKVPNIEPLLTLSGVFQTSNPTCPVVSHQLLVGEDSYELTDDASEGFTLTMEDDDDENEQLYPYQVQATADGGAIATVEGTKDIKAVCLAFLNPAFPTTYVYDLPESGQENITWPLASTDYVTKPPTESEYLPDGVSCSQSFSYKIAGAADDSPNPVELVIDETTGILTLTNDATIKTTYNVEIHILTTDGTNDDNQMVSITIDIVCGADSTILTPPQMSMLSQAPNLEPLLTIDGQFTTSNPNCPVASHELMTGEGNFLLIDQVADFIITMTESANAVEQSYPYVVLATAEGDAIAETSGVMIIGKACVAELNPSFALDYTFEIPETDSEVVTFPSASTDFISRPIDAVLDDNTDSLPNAYTCMQTYSYRMKGSILSSDNPDELVLDESTGIFSLTNDASIKTIYEVEIDVLTTDGTNDVVQTVTGVTINTVCGPDSTTLTRPEVATLSQAPYRLPVLSTGGYFETSNELCPIAEFSIDTGEETFVLTDNDAAEFAVTMTEEANQVEQVYSYVVRATAEGGATETVSGEMIIAKVCLADLNSEFEMSYSYNLPEFGEVIENFPDVSTNYISQPDFTQGCSQTFSYRLANGRPNPAELTMNEQTGIFTLANNAAIKTVFVVDIEIRTTDGIPENHIDLTVSGITIEIVCGPDSTTLTPPTLEILRKASVETNTLTIRGAEFATSNPLCPVASYELTSASAHNNTYIEAPYLITPSLPAFTVELDRSKLGIEDTYYYTVTATAEGGSSAEVSSSMVVYNACINNLIANFEKVYSFFLPESTIVDQNVISSSSDYVEAPFPGCTHSFAYTLSDGGANPLELTIDARTGTLDLETSYLRKINYVVEIEITNSGGNDDIVNTIPNVEISVVCGPDSTILTAPEIEFLQKGNIYDDILSHTKLFEVSNELCPIIDYELTAGISEYDFVQNDEGTFTVTLNAETSPDVGIYPFTVVATAEGGNTLNVRGRTEVQKICITTAVEDFSKYLELFVPEEDRVEESFPDSYHTYVNTPGQPDGCTQTFSYVMSDGSEKPERFGDDIITINSISGVFTMTKYPTSLQTYTVDIIIDTTGGIQDEQITVSDVVISMVCGPESTTLTAPDLLVKSKASFQTDYELSVYGEFSSSSRLCPVQSHEIVTGGEPYILTDNGGDFVISMLPSVISLRQYPYTIRATAQGGATATIDSYMEVNNEFPAPVITPSETFTNSDTGEVLELFNMGDSRVPATDINDGDGASYVSEIQVCSANVDSDTIVGLRFTSTSIDSGYKTDQGFEGYQGYCGQSVILAGEDCFQMLNLVTDSAGNAVRLAYRRSTATDLQSYESIGYGDGAYEGQNSVDFGENGCLTGYRLAFGSGSGRLLADDVPSLRGMAAISNPNLQESVSLIAEEVQESDVVLDPGADSQRTEMLSGSTGLFDWATTKNLTGVSACTGPEGSIVGLKMIFTDDVTGLTETKQLGSQLGLTCVAQQIEQGQCITAVSVDGSAAVTRIAFETNLGEQIIIGSSVANVNRWNSANAEQKCLTGIFGVYEIVDEEIIFQEDAQMMLSVGFYFEEGVEDEIILEEPETKKGFTVKQFVTIIFVILGVGMCLCICILAVVICLKRPKEIVIEGVTEVVNEDNGSIRMKTPRMQGSMYAPHPKDNDTMSFNEMGSIAHMFHGTTETMKMEELLKQINLRDKYLAIFQQHAIETIDDFMELEPDQLESLNLEESDLATILMKIQTVMDEEDNRLAQDFQAKSVFDKKTANRMETIEFSKVLRELNLSAKYLNAFSDNGIDTLQEFLALDEQGLEKLKVEAGDMDKILRHIQRLKEQEEEEE